MATIEGEIPDKNTDLTQDKTTTSRGNIVTRQIKRIKKKLSATTSYEDLLVDWTQCCFLIAKKHRLCNVSRARNSKYCGTHAYEVDKSFVVDNPTALILGNDIDVNRKPLSAHSEWKSNDNDLSATIMCFEKKPDENIRIPCPIDSSHTIFKHNLYSHVKICNAAKRLHHWKSVEYYRVDCNSGGSGPLRVAANDQCNALESVNAICPNALMIKLNRVFEVIANNILPSCDMPVSAILDLSDDSNSRKRSKIDVTAVVNPDSAILLNAKDNFRTEIELLDKRIAETVGGDLNAFSKTRHVYQDIAIIHHMMAQNLLRPRLVRTSSESDSRIIVQPDVSSPSDDDTLAKPTVFVELGAGRGMLGYAISSAQPDHTVVFVERSGVRKKADTLLRKLSDRNFHRVRMDIRHCYVPDLPGVGQTNPNGSSVEVVVVAKHLCGVATDLALRSLEHLSVRLRDERSSEQLQSPRTAESHAMPENPAINSCKARAKGVSVATCCHHACVWDDYVGRDFMIRHGFDSEEFRVLCMWSGWNSLINTKPSRKPKLLQSAEEPYAGQPDYMQVDESSEKVLKSDEEASERCEDVDNDDADDNQHNEYAPTALDMPLNHRYRPSRVSADEMSVLGYRAKRLLDEGRVDYLKALGFNSAKQQVFCEAKYSPECVLIVANIDNDNDT